MLLQVVMTLLCGFGTLQVRGGDDIVSFDVTQLDEKTKETILATYVAPQFGDISRAKLTHVQLNKTKNLVTIRANVDEIPQIQRFHRLSEEMPQGLYTAIVGEGVIFSVGSVGGVLVLEDLLRVPEDVGRPRLTVGIVLAMAAWGFYWYKKHTRDHAEWHELCDDIFLNKHASKWDSDQGCFGSVFTYSKMLKGNDLQQFQANFIVNGKLQAKKE